VTRLARAAELIGLPVVALDTASAVGEVRDVLVDPERSRVIGFTVRGQGLLSPALLGILTGEHVRAIGRDALMVGSDDDVLRQRQGMGSALRDKPELVGREVVTRSGASLGTVSDVVVEVEGPVADVVGYEIDRPDGQTVIVPVRESAPLSTEALLVPDEVERDAVRGLAGFREVLDSSRPRVSTTH
jgi:uncharacterized protein YrrD